MVTRTIFAFTIVGILFLSIPAALIGREQRDVFPLSPWAAPLYWQPTQAESQAVAKPDRLGVFSSDATSLAAAPVGSLVFVGMTPCRIADTRGPNGTFGGPRLVGGQLPARAFPILSSPCAASIPSNVGAYSLNITVVPPGATFPGSVNPGGALGFFDSRARRQSRPPQPSPH